MRRFFFIICLALLSGCTWVGGTITEYPDGRIKTTIAYRQCLEDKEVTVTKRPDGFEIIYRSSADPATQMLERVYEMGKRAGAAGI